MRSKINQNLEHPVSNLRRIEIFNFFLMRLCVRVVISSVVAYFRVKKDIQLLPNSQGATHSFSLALFRMVSGRGSECRTIAPYSPYSAIIVLLPQHFSVFLHFARLFWNHTCKEKGRKLFFWFGIRRFADIYKKNNLTVLCIECFVDVAALPQGNKKNNSIANEMK